MPPKSQTSSSASSILPQSYSLKSSTELCSLWSNYGSISRLAVTQNTDADTKSTTTTLILKSILPPPSTSPDDESHLRKLISYSVERYFYTHLAPHLSPLVFTKVATPISINPSTGQLLLEDLTPSYPTSAYGSLASAPTTAVLKWLAGFHATFWSPLSNNSGDNINTNTNINIGTPIPPPLSVSSPTTTNGIWQQGGYWYLSTRSEEHSALLDSNEYAYLLPWISHVDSSIRKEKPQWKTLIHGDVKAANILFNHTSSSINDRDNDVKAALYDFQYCGISTPAVDLVYFLSTTVDRRSLTNLEGLLREYFDELCDVYAKAHGGDKLDDGLGYTFDVLKKQWDVALVDWMRFMAGWGCWGNWRWVESSVKDIIKRWEKEGKEPVSE
ncbi:hypothetical protein TWF694_008816 [Orbilia ellipsospora]|uniref:CHK kinase-like domain-containing protein n=1 Tax=Orbilia ellipsospora TaxID=2528407 RepID=A0AAV9XDL0_9PEZI